MFAGVPSRAWAVVRRLSANRQHLRAHRRAGGQLRSIAAAEGIKMNLQWRSATDEEKAHRKKLYGHPLANTIDVAFADNDQLCYPSKYVKMAEEIYNMELRPDDVWVVTYPKCGTTWSQEMIWQIKNNYDPEGGKVHLDIRFPFIEIPMLIKDDLSLPQEYKAMEELMKQANQNVENIKKMPSPRFIKTHLPPNLLPPKLFDTCKVVFVARNPKDCCVSMYNHETMIPMHGLTTDFPTYAKFFLEGKIVYGDYWYHLEQCWKFRNHPNALFLWFEDMKQDLIPVIKKTAKHLGVHLTELKVLQIDDHLYFDNFKKNPAVNMEVVTMATGRSFINKGKVGNWKSHFTPEINEQWAKWIRDNKQKRGIDHDFKL